MEGGDYRLEEGNENPDHPGAFVICPYCKGKGYCEESEINYDSNFEVRSNGFALPVIGSTKSNNISITKSALKERFNYKLPALLPEQLPTTKKSSSRKLRPPSNGGKAMSDTSETMMDLIGHQDVENPLEFSRIAKAQLTAPEWNDRIRGIQGAVHLSRIEPELVIQQGRIVSRAILGELGSLRSRCVRIACQAAKELFKLSGFVFRPEFDEIVYSLLCRAADNKRTIRDEADEALSIIAAYTPIQHVARAVTKGPSHKHQMVRKSALRIYRIIVSRLGATQLMKNINYHDIRNKVLEAGCIFLDDQISEIRNSAREMMKPLVKLPEFEEAIAQDLINSKSYQRVENCLFTMKYELEAS